MDLFDEDTTVNRGAFFLLAGLFGLLLLLIQRTEAKRRRLAIILMGLVGLLTLYWAGVRELGREFAFAILAALIFNFLFWLLIGRYNPVSNSDDTIQVIGMDD